MRVPWRDRHGRFLAFKAIVLAVTFLPGLVYSVRWISGSLGARGLNEVIHASGNWSVRWLLLSLAITPAARLIAWPRLLTVRRIVGLAALAHAAIHLVLYIVDQKFNLLTVVTEIVLRSYLTIGFAALLALTALGLTSTDAAIKRMGRSWKKLHRLAYPIGALALLHFYIQTKANVAEPVLMSGLFVWLMLWRLVPEPRRQTLATMAALVPISAILTIGLEFAWYGLATRADPFRILAANWDWKFFPRPAHEVAAIALMIAAVVVARRLLAPPVTRGVAR